MEKERIIQVTHTVSWIPDEKNEAGQIVTRSEHHHDMSQLRTVLDALDYLRMMESLYDALQASIEGQITENMNVEDLRNLEWRGIDQDEPEVLSPPIFKTLNNSQP